MKLKPIKQQVIVITGASSGIGLATARLAAKKGARVVLASRNSDELNRIVNDLNQKYAKDDVVAIAVPCDVANPDEVDHVAHVAIQRFSGFDTWINNAGVSIYGKLWETPLAEKRRLFDVNFWGVVHGCRSALKHLRARGGAIINLGSSVSERAILIQGIYSATKHAVKAYTDALRMEVEEAGFPVSVTLIRPAAIDTPYTQHARSHMKEEPMLPPPIYKTEVAAKAIIECAKTPHRDVYIGGASKAFSVLEHYFPRVTDKFMEKTMVKQQQSTRANDYRDSLFTAPRREGETKGNYPGHVMRTSAYTAATLHPLKTVFLSVVAFGGLGALWYLNNRYAPTQAIRTRDIAMGRTMSGTVSPRLH